MEGRRDPSVPAWAGRLTGDLDAADRFATGLARGLNATQLNWRPTEGVWSVGQCLEHLRLANDVYLAPIANALNGRQPSPVQEITPGWFGRWFIRTAIEPSSQRRRGRAPGRITPARQVDPSVLDLFLESNVSARNLIRRAAACDVNRIRFVNPFIPLVRFTVGTGLEIVTRHERRHLLQAERIKRSPAFPPQ